MKVLVVISLILTSACIAPLSSNFTGRSLGRGKIGLDGGAVLAESAIPSFKLAVGLSSNFDLGAQYDGFSLGVFAKNSFINGRDRGFSLAGVLGVGVVSGGAYAYAGPVLSVKAGAFEPYLVGRVNFVAYGSSDSSSTISWDAGQYFYFQGTLGSVVWLSRCLGLNIEASVYAGPSGMTEGLALTFLAGGKIRF